MEFKTPEERCPLKSDSTKGVVRKRKIEQLKSIGESKKEKT